MYTCVRDSCRRQFQTVNLVVSDAIFGMLPVLALSAVLLPLLSS